MESNVLPVGSLVYVTCYGPYWGLRGIIRAVDVITLVDTQESLSFYLVALQEGQIEEPLWLVHDDVAVVEGDSVAPGHARRRDGSGDACRGAMRVLVREERVR